MHLQRNNLYVSQNIEQENLTVNQVLVPIFFSKAGDKDFPQTRIVYVYIQVKKTNEQRNALIHAFPVPTLLRRKSSKTFLKVLFYLKNPEEISMIWYIKKNYKSSRGILLQFQVFSWILLTFHFSLFISPLIPIPPMS